MSNSPASGEAFLVIGGCGFLGATIARALKARGEAYVSVFDIATAREPIEKVTYHTGDLTDPQSFGEAVRSSKSSPGGAEKGVVVIHTASPVHGMGTQVYEKVNVQGTQNVIQVAKDEGVRKLVFTSSAGVVFDGQDLINVDERMPYPEKPMDAYNDTKARAEQLILAANSDEAGGLKTCALRPAGIFGPGDRQALPGFFDVLRTGKTHFQIGDNTNLFDWTYVDNVAHAHLLASDKLLSRGYDATLLPVAHLPVRCLGIEERGRERDVPTSEARGSPPGAQDYARSLPSTLPVATREQELDIRPVVRNKFDQFFHLTNPEMATPGNPIPDARIVETHIPVAGQPFFVTNGQPMPFWDFPRALWARMGHVVPAGKHWVIGREWGLTLAGLAETYGKITGRPVQFTQFRVTYTAASRYYNIEKARRALGYEPVVGIEEGIRRSVEWWKAEQAKSGAVAPKSG